MGAMIFSRKVLLLIAAFTLVCLLWLWWNHSPKADMTAAAPADSLLYIEVNNLPDVLSALVQTDAWTKLAAPAGLNSNFKNVGWLSRLAAWTGIGPADAVVFARAQVAVTIAGFDLNTNNLKPRAAIVLETHTGESRTRAAIEKRIGEFASRTFSQTSVEKKEVDGAQWIVWHDAAESVKGDEAGTRRIIAAVMGSRAVIGNDEQTVRACLAVQRGEHPSLAGNAQLEAMRKRVEGNSALAFGYVSQAGAAKLLELTAAVYANQITINPRAQSFAASVLPRFAGKILGDVGWSARLASNQIEDRYFLTLQNNLAASLTEPLAPPAGTTLDVYEFLPADTYSVTRYNYRDPLQAWRGLNNLVSSQLDPVSGTLVQTFLNAALQPYGIENANQFLRLIGSQAVTARLDNTGASTVLIVEAKDEKALKTFIAGRLGASPRVERIGDAELLISRDAARGAASFIKGHLLMGQSEMLRRCLAARNEKRTLASLNSFTLTARAPLVANSTGALTLTGDKEPARDFISFVAAHGGSREGGVKVDELQQALGQLEFAATETRLANEGFVRTTHSSFGQFGALVTQFARDEEK